MLPAAERQGGISRGGNLKEPIVAVGQEMRDPSEALRQPTSTPAGRALKRRGKQHRLQGEKLERFLARLLAGEPIKKVAPDFAITVKVGYQYAKRAGLVLRYVRA
jgi:hypothetical protein